MGIEKTHRKVGEDKIKSTIEVISQKVFVKVDKGREWWEELLGMGKGRE